MTASPRPPLINRPLVGVLAIVGIVSGLGVVAFDSFDSAWGASLFRVGLLLACLWLFLTPRRKDIPATPPSPIATWLTASLAGLALVAIRSRKPGVVFFVGFAFAVIGFIVRPRQRRG